MPIANFGEPDPCMSIEEHFAADLPEEYARQQLVAARARIGELEAENARLRDALVDAETHGIPGGYIGVYPDEPDRSIFDY